jgi:hypothetical protein
MKRKWAASTYLDFADGIDCDRGIRRVDNFASIRSVLSDFDQLKRAGTLAESGGASKCNAHD